MLSSQFLDELRARTSLSGLIGASVKLTRKGGEHSGLCPFHHEKTPSFTVNDDKAFYHCFGCGAHGDAIRWMMDQRGLSFIDAVRELAEAAGLEVPAPSPEWRAREAAIVEAGAVLAAAGDWYARQLAAEPQALALLEARGVSAASVERFGLGLAPRARSVSGCGASPAALGAAGLMIDGDDGWRDRFRQRIMIPIHDARGRMIGFGGRAVSERQDAKYVNSPEGPHFDKGRTLYNLHRATEACRRHPATAGGGGAARARRLVIVEGYFDVIALDAAGVAEAVAPMGTALTEAQLARAWRVHPCPILLLDGDRAGERAAMKACERAMPAIGPGASLWIATLPAGDDPDSFVRAHGRDALEAVLDAAEPLSAFVFDRLVADAGDLDTPEARAALWERLKALAMTIADDETRAQYLATWRARFDREASASADVIAPLPALHAQIPAEEGDYSWPEEVGESERRLILGIRRLIELRAQRAEIGQTIRGLLAVMKAAGFDTKAINATIRDLETDESAREGHEALWALYRRVMGVKGPMGEAMLPSPIAARQAKVTNAVQRRLSKAMVLIDAREGGVGSAGGGAHG